MAGPGSSQPQRESRTFEKSSMTKSTDNRNLNPRSGVQASIQKLNQHLQGGGFYDVSPGGTRGRSSDVSKKKITTFGKHTGAKSPKTATGSLNSIGGGNTPKYATKEHNPRFGHQTYNLTGHSEAHEDESPYSGGHTDLVHEGTSAEFLASLGLKTNYKSSVEKTPKSSEPLKKSNGANANETRARQTIKEITFGAHGSNSAKAELRRGANSAAKETSGQWSTTDPNLWKQAALPRSTEPDHRAAKSVEKHHHATEGSQGNFKISGVSERTKEVLQSLLGDVGNGEMYQNIMRKLEESAAAQTLATQSQQVTESDDHHHHLRTTKELSHSGIGYGQTTASINKPFTDRRTEYETENPTEERRGVSLGGEAEIGFGLGLRTEKYVSVNMIKRILDANLIYTEDIVDEVFRYLGENIVNKNYFAQIIGVFLCS